MRDFLYRVFVCKSLSFVSLRQNNDLGKERKPMYVRVD